MRRATHASLASVPPHKLRSLPELESVAWKADGRVIALASHRCRAVAMGPRPTLLIGDAAHSDVTGMEPEGDTFSFRSCGAHRGDFEAAKGALAQKGVNNVMEATQDK